MTGELLAAPALRYWRLQAAYTRAELSRATGVSLSAIARLERGARSRATLVTRLSDFLAQDLEQAVDLSQPPTPAQQAWLHDNWSDHR
jgi:transcriptional regulator with XRE-family HTH domain